VKDEEGTYSQKKYRGSGFEHRFDLGRIPSRWGLNIGGGENLQKGSSMRGSGRRKLGEQKKKEKGKKNISCKNV